MIMKTLRQIYLCNHLWSRLIKVFHLFCVVYWTDDLRDHSLPGKRILDSRIMNPVRYVTFICQVLGFSQSWEVCHIEGFVVVQTCLYDQSLPFPFLWILCAIFHVLLFETTKLCRTYPLLQHFLLSFFFPELGLWSQFLRIIFQGYVHAYIASNLR